MVPLDDADRWPGGSWAHRPLVSRHPVPVRNGHRRSGPDATGPPGGVSGASGRRTDRPAPASRAHPWVTGSLVAAGLVLAVAFAWVVLVTLRPAPTGAVVGAPGAEIGRQVSATVQADRVLSVVQWVSSVTTTLALGGALFTLGVDRTPAKGTIGILRRAACAGMAAELATLPVRAVEVTGARLAAAWDPEALRFVVTGRFGDAALVRIGGLALLARAGRSTRAGTNARCVLGGFLVLASHALVGHPQATHPAYLLVPAQAAHVLAVSAWFGGLVLLAAELRAQRHAGTARAGAELVARFSTLATVTVVLAAVSGLVLARSQLPSLAALPASAYGRALLVKLAALAVPLALGGYNRQRLVPAIVERAEPAAWRRLRHTLALEATIVALGVLLATAAMTSGGFP